MTPVAPGTTAHDLRAPFPWFGGKSRAASLIWQGLGELDNYVEPFAGSLAVLLGAPRIHRAETVNDKDGFICNWWRAVAADPEQVARYADWPVNENDLHARHSWLVGQHDTLTARLEGDPTYYDAKIAGWWVWGICCWIGSGWCSGNGPWKVVDGELVHLGDAGQGVHRKLVHLGDAGQGVHRQRVHLGDAGRGVHRQRVHLGDAGQGVHRQLVHLGDAGQGVHRQLVHLGDAGQGVHRQRVHLGNAGQGVESWFQALATRLRRVRVCCGDWARVLGPTPTTKLGLTGVVLDPPYLESERCADIYAMDDGTIAHRVREWAIQHGDDPMLRIVLCGYEGEHDMPGSWQTAEWAPGGGYGSQGTGRGAANRHRERLWFSPHCAAAPPQMDIGL